jgi:hypothetical protein
VRKVSIISRRYQISYYSPLHTIKSRVKNHFRAVCISLCYILHIYIYKSMGQRLSWEVYFCITSSPLVKSKVLLRVSQTSHFKLSHESLILVNFPTRFFPEDAFSHQSHTYSMCASQCTIPVMPVRSFYVKLSVFHRFCWRNITSRRD